MVAHWAHPSPTRKSPQCGALERRCFLGLRGWRDWWCNPQKDRTAFFFLILMGFHFSRVLEVARDLLWQIIFGSSFRIVDGTSWIHWDGKRLRCRLHKYRKLRNLGSHDLINKRRDTCHTLGFGPNPNVLWRVHGFHATTAACRPWLRRSPVHCSAGPFAGPQQSWIRRGRLPQPDLENT